MYHSFTFNKMYIMWSEGKQFEQEESLGGARAEHLSGWREIDAVKQSYMDCSANFLTSELFWKRVREPANDRRFLRLTGEQLKNDHSEPPFPPISTNWEPCTVKWGSRTSLTLSVPLRYFKKSEKQADKKKRPDLLILIMVKQRKNNFHE